MNEPHRPAASPNECPRRPWVWLGWLALAAIWFGSLGYRALIHPDEGRYASISLEMLQRSDWLTPHLNGFLYFEKPILQYWMGAASFAVFGINEFAARFWPGLTGFLTVIAVAVTGRRLWGGQAGLFAALAAAGTTWIIGNSHFLTLDMGLTLFLTVALCGFLVAQRDEASDAERRNAMWLTWAAMAGATLSKGLVGLVIPGATLVLYSLTTWQWAFWRRMHWLSGLIIFFALAAPWFVAVSLKNPGFFDFFFIREHFQRFLTDEAKRTGAFYYFVPILIVGLLPWTTLLPALCNVGLRREPRLTFQPLRLLLIWSIFVFVFFSISKSKLPSYILPMFPALALLMARYFVEVNAERLKRHLLLPMAFWLILLAAVPFVGRFASPDSPIEVLTPFAHAIALAALLFLVPALAAWRLLGRGRKLAAVALIAAGSLAAVTTASLGHDSYGQLKSSKAVVAKLTPYLKPDSQIFSVGYYEQSFPYYLRRNVTLVAYTDEFSYGQGQEPQRWMPKVEQFTARWRAIPHAAAMMSSNTYKELQQQGLPMQLVYQDARRVVVVKP
ncbi:glycosyltransferase family 39 protein [Crenobacter sp. SG2305]|uniref:ArnT family glycosyltransferase n=1 Tax=Crenobacter oryzisoli TaxID=3056844 RepID=UPI0025AAF953|nr:glycosyltransferase family 39 protein [Crenobacter sp. SG2305]MDN0081809.1 glycosyltransferase family 39 protein [Crenobacter sp. SG2305]